ncbi:hypothetical protein ACFQ1S_21760 [Kibdelosporangium lantanae]|uniref:Secreted protein n=1 Tax=Kibdelosporangium lantanae TaxID=1497396 RepID=A0ABW3MBF7_9PSEU
MTTVAALTVGGTATFAVADPISPQQTAAAADVGVLVFHGPVADQHVRRVGPAHQPSGKPVPKAVDHHAGSTLDQPRHTPTPVSPFRTLYSLVASVMG